MVSHSRRGCGGSLVAGRVVFGRAHSFAFLLFAPCWSHVATSVVIHDCVVVFFVVQVPLMRVVDSALAAMDAHRGVAVVAESGLGFLRNMSTAEPNRVRRQAMGVLVVIWGGRGWCVVSHSRRGCGGWRLATSMFCL